MIIAALVVVIVALIVLRPQIHNIYQTGPDDLWLHLIGL